VIVFVLLQSIFRDPIGFAYDVVHDILSTESTTWDTKHGILTVRFYDPETHVEIYIDKDGPITNHIRGIMISRPIVHPEYLSRILQILKLGNVMMFYSDDTTPIFCVGADPRHYPVDLLDELGNPRFIDSPNGLLHQK
jgi:hypothetical protein